MPKILKFEEARDNLKKRFPYLELLSFEGSHKPCRVLDLEYNEEFISSRFSSVFEGVVFCPTRRKLKKQESLKKTKETNLRKYGVESVSQAQSVKDKKKQTNLKKYGVENPFQTMPAKKLTLEEAKRKLKEKFPYLELLTYERNDKPCEVLDLEYNESFIHNCYIDLRKKGGYCPSRKKKLYADKYEKNKQRNLEKYGVENLFQSEEIKERIKQTNLKKHGTTNPFQSEKIREKFKSTMLQRYGKEHPKPTKIFNGKTTKELIDETGLSKSHILSLIKQNIDPATFEKHETIIEKKIKDLLINLNMDFIQESTQFKEFIPDFLLEDHKIIIEADGLYWHSESVLTNRKQGKNHSMQRRRFFENLGYRVIVFREDQILNQFNIVESIIRNALKLTSIKIGARELEIQEIDQETTRRFLDENHLMGRGAGRAFGLVDKEGNIQSLIQVKCKSRERNEFEVSRFCNKLNTTVSGAFSRLLKETVRVFNPSSIITFTDLNYGTGNYLVNFGFKKETEYPSFKWTDYRNVWNRMEFRGNSGAELGLDRVWDSGQRKWSRNY